MHVILCQADCLTGGYIFSNIIINKLNFPVFIHWSAQKAMVQAKTAIKWHEVSLSW